MPLHRDIYWVGRQWAVTGYGMQAVDQKQKSKFDIAISRLWDADLVEGLSAERWFNLADFNEGLAIARARYPAAPGTSVPRNHSPPRSTLETVSPLKERVVAQTGNVNRPLQIEAKQSRSELWKPAPQAGPDQPNAAKFAMRVNGGCAKFTSMWRVRIKR